MELMWVIKNELKNCFKSPMIVAIDKREMFAELNNIVT